MAGHLLATVGAERIWSSLRAAFFMFWETLWALGIGFALSGIVQAAISRDAVERRLGGKNPGSIARAAGYGAASSSCSYAASAIAKSLFAKGADFTTAVIFMVASTNLVIELGLVLAALLGWRFVLAEAIGGVVMIVVLALVSGFLFPGAIVERARAHLTDAERLEAPGVAGAEAELPDQPRHWAAAVGYAFADARMLRLELALGFIAAGFAGELVPAGWWSVLFLHGHGIVGTVENAAIGPLIAFVSFVCSIGNVPLAAALWHVGISFAGVLAFVFADLLAAPLVLIYLRYYGTRLALRLVGALYVSMVAAGLATQALLAATGLEPASHPAVIVPERLTWNYTSVLDLAVIGAAIVMTCWRRRDTNEVGEPAGFAHDPVCGMQVRVADAPVSLRHDSQTIWFCSDHCAARFRQQQREVFDPTASSRHRVQ